MILKYNGDAFDQVFEKIGGLRRLSNYFKVLHIVIYNGCPSKNPMPIVVSFSLGVVIHFSPLAAN